MTDADILKTMLGRLAKNNPAEYSTESCYFALLFNASISNLYLCAYDKHGVLHLINFKDDRGVNGRFMLKGIDNNTLTELRNEFIKSHHILKLNIHDDGKITINESMPLNRQVAHAIFGPIIDALKNPGMGLSARGISATSIFDSDDSYESVAIESMLGLVSM